LKNNKNSSNSSSIELRNIKNQNFIENRNQNINKNNINQEINYDLEIENNKVKVNNASTPKKKNLLIKQLKIELSQVLFEDKDKTFKSESQANYITYIMTEMCCCLISKEKKKMFEFEVNRVQKLLNVETFHHYLTEAYAIKYKQIKE
jgi:hypothetical protein